MEDLVVELGRHREAYRAAQGDAGASICGQQARRQGPRKGGKRPTAAGGGAKEAAGVVEPAVPGVQGL
jgi:hypothetical protein